MPKTKLLEKVSVEQLGAEGRHIGKEMCGNRGSLEDEILIFRQGLAERSDETEQRDKEIAESIKTGKHNKGVLRVIRGHQK